MDANNLTIIEDPPQWQASSHFKMPSWGEPLLVVAILFSSMYITRRRNYSIFPKAIWKRTTNTYNSYLDNPSSPNSSSTLLSNGQPPEDDSDTLSTTSSLTATNPPPKHPPQTRHILSLKITTPNTTRFTNNPHSRLLQKYPFLIEMFYWILTYLFYRLAHTLTNALFTTSIVPIAESHGLGILNLEQFSPISFLFPLHEISLQEWFLKPSHETYLSFLNHIYSLLHIPLTAAFIAFYYYIAPSHAHFATFRRTLTLENLIAFFVFTLYPTMPPRLLPAEYGFRDTVHEEGAGSVWMKDGSDFVNSLAAMPSMHFGYAVVIGSTLIYHSGVFRRRGRRQYSWSHSPQTEVDHTEDDEEKEEEQAAAAAALANLMPWTLRLTYLTLGIAYPLLILTAIIATANHYWLDALAAIFVCGLGFVGNEVFMVFLPAEDWLCWVLRVRKPRPTTGEKFQREKGREGNNDVEGSV